MSKPVLAARVPRQYDPQTLAVLLRIVETAFERLSAFAGQATWNPSSVANGASTTTTVTVPGVKANTMASVRVFPPYTLSGLVATGYVSADDTVTIVLANNTGGAVDLGSGTWGVVVENFVRTS